MGTCAIVLLQCVLLRCSVLQVCGVLQCIAELCILQCVVLQCVAASPKHPCCGRAWGMCVCVLLRCLHLFFVAVSRSIAQYRECVVLQCVAVCCSVFQCVAVCSSAASVHCSSVVLLCAAVLRVHTAIVLCCSVLRCVAVSPVHTVTVLRCSMLQSHERCNVLRCILSRQPQRTVSLLSVGYGCYVAVCCNLVMLQYLAVLQCLAVSCNMLHCRMGFSGTQSKPEPLNPNHNTAEHCVTRSTTLH